MHSLTQKFFDIFFPPSAHSLSVRNTTITEIEHLFHIQSIDGVIALSHFSHPQIRALVHEAKFHANERAHSLLGILLKQYLKQSPQSFDMCIPIPLSKARMRARGHNQVVSILKASDVDIPINTRALVRTRDTHPQSDLPREKRLQNMKHAFAITDSESVRSKHILLIDDVVTTGATLHAAKEILVQCGATSVTCLAFAH